MTQKSKSEISVQMRPLEALIPYACNARVHTDAQVAQIAASIREFGWTNPILVDCEGSVIAGHGRLLAARQLGLKKVPVIELSQLTPAQRRAYIIADNRLALNASWDEKLLAADLSELKTAEFDLELLGFEEDEIDHLLGDGTHAGEERQEPSLSEQWWIMVEVDGEREQKKLLERLTAEGFKCKAQVI